MEALGDDQAGIHRLKIKNFEAEAKKLEDINLLYKKQREEAIKEQDFYE